MNRRGFLSILRVMAPFGLLLHASGHEDGTNPKRRTFYRGYQIRWTGWKGCQNTDNEIGQWIGYPVKDEKLEWGGLDEPARPILVASIPGCQSAIPKGETFDISLQRGQRIILWTTKPMIKERERRRTLKGLQSMIDCVADHPEIRNLSVGEWNRFLEDHRAIRKG